MFIIFQLHETCLLFGYIFGYMFDLVIFIDHILFDYILMYEKTLHRVGPLNSTNLK